MAPEDLAHGRLGERSRLESIQSATDRFSVGVLEGLALPTDAQCLELGAGAGSLAYWLARYRPDGRVVAVDIDPTHLDAGRAPNLEVVRADITEESYAPGRFDLVHARFVFCHLADRDALVARAARWLRPGGWLVVTDPFQLPAETSPFPLVRRLMGAYSDVCAAQGTDLTWVRSVPALLAGVGLSPVDFVGRAGCMGNLGGDRWRLLIDRAAPALLASGKIDRRDLEAFHEHLVDPAFVDIPQMIVTAWGRRPPWYG